MTGPQKEDASSVEGKMENIEQLCVLAAENDSKALARRMAHSPCMYLFMSMVFPHIILSKVIIYFYADASYDNHIYLPVPNVNLLSQILRIIHLKIMLL